MTGSKGLESFAGKGTDTIDKHNTHSHQRAATTTTTDTGTATDYIESINADSKTYSKNKLFGKKILVALVAFDFGQLPHFEEVLDSYHDLCITGAFVDVYIYATVPYPVALIDLLNTRLTCEGLTVKIILKTPAVRLNLVDFHRTLFYDKVDDYDLFIYSEDDIRVTPKTVMAYVQQTKRIEEIVGKSPAEDYNIGIIRYEYNFPENQVIDDKTRKVTQNVTRVYWEHLSKPMIPKSFDSAPDPELANEYIIMANKHQGMFMATRDLLKAWRDRPGCEFNVIRQRPSAKNKPGQPSEGTQRVWMSSNMLYGKKHCNVTQLLPIETFGQHNVLHLPNKNYRRIGKKGRLGDWRFGDKAVDNHFGFGNETFSLGDSMLPKAMEVHLEMRKAFSLNRTATGLYSGIQMIDEVDTKRFFKGKREYVNILDDRLKAFADYVKRGGILAQSDIDIWTGALESW